MILDTEPHVNKLIMITNTETHKFENFSDH